jgi:hypothetical protein
VSVAVAVPLDRFAVVLSQPPVDFGDSWWCLLGWVADVGGWRLRDTSAARDSGVDRA